MSGRTGFDSTASGETQGKITKLSAQIETLLSQHKANVKAMRADATMTKVMDDYDAVEAKFDKAAAEVHTIIKSLSDTLKQYDGIGETAHSAASTAVRGMTGG
ncbi:hypothetical protein F1D05_03220 [Kribbella qitaiheensis]|uniref:Uncharacterized protein n=1 Tax=Kribbella qitaiheensis TaxID=1544730 RepID=A0A7G6WSY2_9ACTN|nr:hypothetical protein [Kribbella qitaiheensis]QNE17097.1 hypothetical protein F1D05_03220 [Kribbella qitaiheensis]